MYLLLFFPIFIMIFLCAKKPDKSKVQDNKDLQKKTSPAESKQRSTQEKKEPSKGSKSKGSKGSKGSKSDERKKNSKDSKSSADGKKNIKSNSLTNLAASNSKDSLPKSKIKLPTILVQDLRDGDDMETVDGTLTDWTDKVPEKKVVKSDKVMAVSRVEPDKESTKSKKSNRTQSKSKSDASGRNKKGDKDKKEKEKEDKTMEGTNDSKFQGVQKYSGKDKGRPGLDAPSKFQPVQQNNKPTAKEKETDLVPKVQKAKEADAPSKYQLAQPKPKESDAPSKFQVAPQKPGGKEKEKDKKVHVASMWDQLQKNAVTVEPEVRAADAKTGIHKDAKTVQVRDAKTMLEPGVKYDPKARTQMDAKTAVIDRGKPPKDGPKNVVSM